MNQRQEYVPGSIDLYQVPGPELPLL